MRIAVIAILLFVTLLFSKDGFGQIPVPPGWYHERSDGYGLRGILSRFNLEVTTGYGRTFYSHRPEGLYVLSFPDNVLLYNGTNTGSSLAQWFHTVAPADSTLVIPPGSFSVGVDTANIKMIGKAFSVPLNAVIFLKIFRFKLGGGATFEPTLIGKFHANNYRQEIGTWRPDVRLAFFKKYYGMFGGDIYRYMNWVVSVDARVGMWNPGNKFDKALMKRSLFYNIGMGLEYELSEYASFYLRPSLELKSYDLTIPEGTNAIKHRAPVAYANFGMILRMPEKGRCFIKDCHVQIDHPHGDKEYRSRVHPIWKKQNPNYGENYPRLIKYKRKNKKKLNPY